MKSYLRQILASDGHVSLWDLLPRHFHGHIPREPKDRRQQALTHPKEVQTFMVLAMTQETRVQVNRTVGGGGVV
jgi:hypothetical protein